MQRRLLNLAAAFVFAACSAGPSPVAAPPPAAFAPAASARRIILFSFDGLAADDVASFGPTYSRLAREGTVVRRVVPVNPTQTFPTHTAMITGAPPEKNGIVANRFHLPGTPANQTASGVEATIEVETIVEAAHHAGKRVGSIAFPTIDNKTARRQADFGIVYGKTVAAPRIIQLTPADFHAVWLPAGWGQPRSNRTSFSPVMRARIDWSCAGRAHHDVDIAAYDTTDDQRIGYDALVVEVDGDETPLDGKGWFSVAASLDDGLYGSWSRILRHDETLASVTLYWGAIAHAQAYPEEFRRLVEREAGFWPSPPDEGAVRNALSGGTGIGPDVFIDQQQRLSQYLERVTLLGIQHMPFDLLLSYQPIIDSAQHQFRITTDTQKNATPESRADGERVRQMAFASFDRVLASVSSSLNPATDALIVTGDHGVGAVDTEVRLGTLLAQWSFNRWTAFAGGGTAHLYRSPGPDDTEALVEKLTLLRAPDGAPVFEQVLRKTAASHSNAGDVVLYAWPRFSLAAGGGEPFATASYYGQHGALNTHGEFHTTLVAWGAGVPETTIDSIRQTQIARYVSQLLGIPAPSSAE
ncbi:MAG: alkaline phosphatase family protein [Acidobacteriota bacterium]